MEKVDESDGEFVAEVAEGELLHFFEGEDVEEGTFADQNIFLCWIRSVRIAI